MMINLSVLRFSRKFANLRLLHQVQVKKNVQEVKIPVPWGHIAGKWWGDTKDTAPFIGLHGWEDNAGTYDTLAPLLKIKSFLALDLPGHGLSSYLPIGKTYYFMDSVTFVRRVVKYFNWNKISLIGHSHGSCVSYVYSAIFPENVDNYISIDCARLPMAPDEQSELAQLRCTADNLSRLEEKMVKNDPPAYAYDDIVELLYQGSNKSPSRDSCKILLKRGSYPAKEANKYCFTRDPRLRYHSLNRIPLEFLLEMAKDMHCNFLGIRGAQGVIQESWHEQYLQTLEIIKKQQIKYEHHDVEGSHHLHLNNPERVAPLINKFLGYS